MTRMFIFGAACVLMFVGIASVMPILEEGIDITQFAASAYPSGEESILSCVISANPQLILKGEHVSIAWMSENAEHAFLAPILGYVDTDGGAFLAPEASDVYVLTVFRGDNEVSCSTYVTVR